jgi:hypothetical protein
MLERWCVFLGATVVLSLSVGAAEASIICREGFQIVDGNAISTPYCNDAYVAEVVRSYGRDVSDDAVRNSPALKDQLCRQFGSDNRIQNYCNTDSGHDAGH